MKSTVYLHDFRYRMGKRGDSFLIWLAWKLPRRLVMWCYIRVGAYATTGQFGNTEVPELTMMEALKRWPE